MYRDKQFSPFVIGPCPAGIKTPSTNEQAVTRAIIRRPHNVLHRTPVCVCVFFSRPYYLCVSSTNLFRCPPNLFLPLPPPLRRPLTRNSPMRTNARDPFRETAAGYGKTRWAGFRGFFLYRHRPKKPQKQCTHGGRTESGFKTLFSIGN